MSETNFLQCNESILAYRLVELPNSRTENCCLLLHGAGVAGELTYGPMLEHLNHWRWLLIPDLTGMGESYHSSKLESPVSIESLTDELDELLEHLSWHEFDIIGYSLGGLVGLNLNSKRFKKRSERHRMVLMEPASLDRECVNTLAEVRQRYKLASKTIRETGDVELGVAHFMDGVSPNRRKHPVAEATTQSRLAHRPIGFSYALDAVTNWVERIVKDPNMRFDLVDHAEEVLLFSGALSHSLLLDHYDLIVNGRDGWKHISMAGCDHSLPFQKPRQIAKHINKWLEE
ncbi:alpha/beta fold hydrolase [Marinomonas ostreistagni]|uniref:Alpha/beta fold hydrolase n=1 Tax=Marinomonas ostreistagni TaxID=359209 RepID=A0ABS0ZAG3_9GAMM|nr:alpha/beta fold hydrolase [Marinomonas ostreistagni]MBJ7550640.1 alpha/beta fold hydrolase [Marinomonas ostreistagni]